MGEGKEDVADESVGRETEGRDGEVGVLGEGCSDGSS